MNGPTRLWVREKPTRAYGDLVSLDKPKDLSADVRPEAVWRGLLTTSRLTEGDRIA
jgi:hypothetical protein